MSIKNILKIIVLLVVFSCKKDTGKTASVVLVDSAKVKTIIVNKKNVLLNGKAKVLVANWAEYQNFDEFIQQFHDISVENALLNAEELSVLSQQLKDSIRIEKLNVPAVRVRLNVLHNEAMRLADMSTISTIKPAEVEAENDDVLNAFAAVNVKINNMLNREKLNSEVSDFLDEIETMDSTKPKSEK